MGAALEAGEMEGERRGGMAINGQSRHGHAVQGSSDGTFGRAAEEEASHHERRKATGSYQCWKHGADPRFTDTPSPRTTTASLPEQP
jgi:hypothetical protein